MDFELYHAIKNIEKTLKQESNVPEFQVFLSTEEDEDINFIIMNKFVENKPELPDYILGTFIKKLKDSGYNYKHCFMYPNPIQVSSVQDNGTIISDTTENNYTLKRVKE